MRCPADGRIVSKLFTNELGSGVMEHNSRNVGCMLIVDCVEMSHPVHDVVIHVQLSDRD
jgi:hypothetical protein